MARPLSSEARQTALDASVDLLAEAGIDGFSIDAVARRSGVAKTTLYRHWSSGSELLIHALDCKIERFPTPDTGSLAGDLLALYRTLFETANGEGHRQLFLDMLAAAARDPELAEVHRAMIHERKRPARQIVQQAVDRGEIPAIDPALATALIEGPFMARAFLSADPMRESELPGIVPLIARGLGAGSAD